MHLHQIAERDDDLAREADAVVVQHVAQCAQDQRNQVHEGDRLVGLQVAQQRAHGATGLHLDERMVVLLQRLLVDHQQIREVVLVRHGEVRREVVDDRRAAQARRRVQRLAEREYARQQLWPLHVMSVGDMQYISHFQPTQTQLADALADLLADVQLLLILCRSPLSKVIYLQQLQQLRLHGGLVGGRELVPYAVLPRVQLLPHQNASEVADGGERGRVNNLAASPQRPKPYGNERGDVALGMLLQFRQSPFSTTSVVIVHGEQLFQQLFHLIRIHLRLTSALPVPQRKSVDSNLRADRSKNNGIAFRKMHSRQSPLLRSESIVFGRKRA